MSYELFFFEADEKNYPPSEDTLRGICPVYAQKYLNSKNEQTKKNATASGILLRDHMNITSDSQLSAHDGFFSLSHSNDCSVLAVSSSPVGVDIEQLSSAPSMLTESIVTQMFPDEWKREYDLAPTDEKTDVFYRLWTKMESHLKAEGCGFTKDPRIEALRWDTYAYDTFLYKDYRLTVAYL